MISREFAKRLANAYYSNWNTLNTVFEVDDYKMFQGDHGWICFPLSNSNSLGDIGCILVTNERTIYALSYFGNIGDAIKRWEDEQCEKARTI